MEDTVDNSLSTDSDGSARYSDPTILEITQPKPKPKRKKVKSEETQDDPLKIKAPSKKSTKQEPAGAKFPNARRIFKERNMQRGNLAQKIKDEQDKQDKKIASCDRMSHILKGEVTEALAWHKSLKKNHRDIINKKLARIITKDDDLLILKKLDEKMSMLSKLVNVALKDVDTQKKAAENNASQLRTIEEALEDFVSQMLSDRQIITEEAIAYSNEKVSSPMVQKKNSVFSNLFSTYRFSPNKCANQVFKSKGKGKGKASLMDE